ncbi:MAG: hypothetical protein ACO3ID_09550 [Candidatus Nanopelagicales bacterium]
MTTPTVPFLRGYSARRVSSLVAGTVAATLLLAPIAMAPTATAAPAPFDSGFSETNAGVKRFIRYAPREATSPAQVNAPLPTQKKADRLAKIFGISKDKTFTKKQRKDFLAGRGTIPEGYTEAEARKAAELTRLATTYLTNTTGNTYTRVINGDRVKVKLGGYGLIVDKDGMLRVPANCPDPNSSDFALCSPVRLINWVLTPEGLCDNPDNTPPPGIPCGYMNAWMRANGAKDTLKMLYSSAWLGEARFADKSQKEGGNSQLIYGTRSDGTPFAVGVPVAPAMWILNYILNYILEPETARFYPSTWTAIPERVVKAIENSDNGQVRYSEYMSSFTR